MSRKSKNGDQAVADQNQESSTETQAEDAVQATQESLDTVRDILFGSQMRDTDRRFGEIEASLAAELAAFREETRSSLTSLQSFVKTELNALTERITSESNQRVEALQGLRNDVQNADRSLGEQLQSTAQAIEKRLAGFDQQHATAESELRGQILEQANTLRSELQAAQNNLQATIEKLGGELGDAKTDRTALATLFNEMAGRLQA